MPQCQTPARTRGAALHHQQGSMGRNDFGCPCAGALQPLLHGDTAGSASRGLSLLTTARPDAGCNPRQLPVRLWLCQVWKEQPGGTAREHGGELGSFLTSWESEAARGPCRLNPGSASPVPVMHGELCPCRSPGEGRGGDGEWCWARSLLCLLAALGCSAGRVSRGDVQVLDVQVLWLGAAGQPLLLHHLRVQQQDMRSGRALQSSGHSFWLFGCVATEYKTQTETPPASFAPAREMVLWGCWAAASQAHGCCGLHPSYPVLSVLMRPAQT